MDNLNTIRRKRSLSLHEKQMRFFTVLSVVVCAVVMVALLWLLNWAGLAAH
jgi:hypothetical protein